MHKELGVAIEAVLTSALPLIAQMTRPGFLLRGKVKAVIKAQCISLSPGEEYERDWRYEGCEEEKIAVVLYCNHCSPGLEGGDLVFLRR